MSDDLGLAPGWYPHQGTPGALRYWNGSEWTDNLTPMPSRPSQQLPDWVSVIGYITMILFPPAGFAIGIVHVSSGEGKAGAAMIAVSVLSAAVVFFGYLAAVPGPGLS